jgi:hypothetical protein
VGPPIPSEQNPTLHTQGCGCHSMPLCHEDTLVARAGPLHPGSQHLRLSTGRRAEQTSVPGLPKGLMTGFHHANFLFFPDEDPKGGSEMSETHRRHSAGLFLKLQTWHSCLAIQQSDNWCAVHLHFLVQTVHLFFILSLLPSQNVAAIVTHILQRRKLRARVVKQLAQDHRSSKCGLEMKQIVLMCQCSYCDTLLPWDTLMGE